MKRVGMPMCHDVADAMGSAIVTEDEIADFDVAYRSARAIAHHDPRVRGQTPRTPVIVEVALVVLERQLHGRANGHASLPAPPSRRRTPARARGPSRLR